MGRFGRAKCAELGWRADRALGFWLARGPARSDERAPMKLGLVGGTGREGAGLSVRWAKVGHQVAVGSRDPQRAVEKARELSAQAGAAIAGGDNRSVVRDAEVVVLCVPYPAHTATLEELKPELAGKLVIDITVPLAPPHVREVHLPEGRSAAQEAAVILGSSAKLVSTLHHVSSAHLGDHSREFACDVLVCGDDLPSKEVALGLVRELGLRCFDAGPLRNAVALESLTPVLLYLNKRYHSDGAGIRIIGLPETP
jgi:NADPH-dependent F420 reductase